TGSRCAPGNAWIRGRQRRLSISSANLPDCVFHIVAYRLTSLNSFATVAASPREHRKRFLPRVHQVAIGFVAVLSASSAWAQAYPVKPVRLISVFAEGGSTDGTARLVAQKLTEQLGQTVVVENRTGAAGAIANERVATSPPDGYTLLMLTPGATILPALRSNLPYDLLRDF